MPSAENGGHGGGLVKLPAGFVAPTHAHTGFYHGINPAGTWQHLFEGGDEGDLSPGSYVSQPGMAMHGDVCVGDEDCIIFVTQDVANDFIPKEQ